MTAAGKEPDTKTHRVFISYAGENNNSTSDRQVADQICAALEAQDIRCWVAHRDILPGDDWMDAITDAIDQTKIVIVVFSAHTEKSQWVKDEVKLALEEKRIIIPFRIQDVYPQRALKLLKVRCQWMDAYTPPLGKHIESLVKIVSRHLGKPIKKEKIEEQPIIPKVTPPDKEKTNAPPDLPEDVKKVISKAHKVEKNNKGYWEAYYQDGIVMVYIPAGDFMMGQTQEEKKWLIDQIGEKDYNSHYVNETPLHQVYLNGYWMGKYEVTFAQYDRYCRENKIKKPGDEGWGRENRPVINVSWEDAAAFCQWLSHQTVLQFNFPTEAQWEKAARGNDQRKYPWGSRKLDKDLANFSYNIGKTTPVGSYPAGASPYGLLDMAGNVWECCSDRYVYDYYKNSPSKNPNGPDSGSPRVIRGGSWNFDARDLRCAYRYGFEPSIRLSYLGFRLRQDI